MSFEGAEEDHNKSTGSEDEEDDFTGADEAPAVDDEDEAPGDEDEAIGDEVEDEIPAVASG